MSEHLKAAFDALLKIHGQPAAFRGVHFAVVAQSGAYAARNFSDGDTAVKILRARADSPAFKNSFPLASEIVELAGTPRIVARTRRIDADFIEIEITDTL